MRLSFVWQIGASVALLAAPSFAQSGGYEPKPRTVTIRPTWANDLDRGLKSAGADPAPVLVLFVADKNKTSRIQATLDSRDTGRPEARTLKNMGYARLIVTRADLKKATQRDEGASEGKAARGMGRGSEDGKAGGVGAVGVAGRLTVTSKDAAGISCATPPSGISRRNPR